MSELRTPLAGLLVLAALALVGCGEKDEPATVDEGPGSAEAGATTTAEGSGGEDTTAAEGADTSGDGAGGGEEGSAQGGQAQGGGSRAGGAGSISSPTPLRPLNRVRRLDVNRADYFGKRVRFRGRATSLGEAGFLVRGDGNAIIVLTPGTRRFTGRVEVTGIVRHFSQYQVSELRESAAAVGQMPLYGRAPLGAGDPYVAMNSVRRLP